MNELRSTKCYLAGSIDRASDDGVNWRREVIYKCNMLHRLGILFLDPTNKPKPLMSESGIEKNRVDQLKAEGKYDEASEFVKKFRRYREKPRKPHGLPWG